MPRYLMDVARGLKGILVHLVDFGGNNNTDSGCRTRHSILETVRSVPASLRVLCFSASIADGAGGKVSVSTSASACYCNNGSDEPKKSVMAR